MSNNNIFLMSVTIPIFISAIVASWNIHCYDPLDEIWLFYVVKGLLSQAIILYVWFNIIVDNLHKADMENYIQENKKYQL